MSSDQPSIPSEMWIDLLFLRGWVVVVCERCGLGTDTVPDGFGLVSCECPTCGHDLCGYLTPWTQQRNSSKPAEPYVDPRTDTWGT